MKNDLISKHCKSCEGIGFVLTTEQIDNLMLQLDKSWFVVSDNSAIHKSFSFKNFYETISFVNAVAWISNMENHHPDLEIGYNYCRIKLSTHALNGLTQNDFICAAKIDRLLDNKE